MPYPDEQTPTPPKPSQAEGERNQAEQPAGNAEPTTPKPSQAEGERE